MKQIKASEVKPGMKIRWERYGFTHEGTVERVTSVGGGVLTRFLSGASGMSVQSDVEVTVLSEPAPVQPEEPTEFGAKVTVGGRKFLRAPLHSSDPTPWLGQLDNIWRGWDDLISMGPVQVVPDQGWTVPAETELTPEVPDRIEAWPENDEHLRPYPWRDTLGLGWRYGVTGGESGWSTGNSRAWKRPFDGPWIRVTDA